MVFLTGSSIQSTRFGDHDELASLIRGADAQFIQRGPGAFRGEFTVLGLDTGTVQFGQVELPYISRGTPSGDRSVFILHLSPQPGYVWRGQILEPGAIVVVPPGSEHQDISAGRNSWALLSFDKAVLDKAVETLTGLENPVGAHGAQVLLPDAGTMERLRCRLKAIRATVRGDPTTLVVPEARRGIEESVLSALALAVGSASRIRPDSFTAASRSRAIRQMEAYLSTHSGDSLYLEDLCAVAGVGERSLRYLFQERYGMSPLQYLKLRRLHQVRRALRRADPEQYTVQGIAHRNGIWHLGRFSMEYRALFGEFPHETLKKVCPLDRSGQETPAGHEARGRFPGTHGVGSTHFRAKGRSA